MTALKTLADYMGIDLRITKKMSIEDAVNCFVIAFEVPDLGCSDYLEIALPALCQAAEHLSLKGKVPLKYASVQKFDIHNVCITQCFFLQCVISKSYGLL